MGQTKRARAAAGAAGWPRRVNGWPFHVNVETAVSACYVTPMHRSARTLRARGARDGVRVCLSVMLLAVLLAIDGCDRHEESSAPSAAAGEESVHPKVPESADSNAAKTAKVDALELGGLCVLAALPTPPHVASNHWQDLGSATIGKDDFAWIMIEQSASPVDEIEADHYLHGLQIAPINPAMNTSTRLCLSRWDEAKQRSVLTAIVRVSGTEDDGTFVVLGTRVARDFAHFAPTEKIEHVDVKTARKKAILAAAKDVGGKFKGTHGSMGWMEAAE